MEYRVTFINCPAKVVYATTRANAITKAVWQTRGYLSKTEQRRNVVNAKLYNQ